ncbi:hypothetical protein DIS24_g9496 [Lasiodiplodia hormozganensis]|uniref:Alpha-l-rhamnosidase c protein n=1 Tax=Lasiodiplodia hormozganensis TaxID=869390 RepID=A0AA39XVC3_9PEZI|nr:hypothetical protein DIS24_g9496 [Lasiodiplodia hormozganensis]
MASSQQDDGGPPPPTNDSPSSPSPASKPSFPPPARSSTTASLASTATSRLRSASLKLLDTDLPPGFMAATGGTAARMHSFSEIRRGSLGTGNSPISPVTRHNSDESGSRKFSRTGTGLSTMSKKGKGAGVLEEEERRSTEGGGHLAVSGGTPLETLRSVTNESGAEGGRVDGAGDGNVKESTASSATRTVTAETDNKPPVTEYANGYQPPPKLPWTTSTALALKAYGKWVLTIPGFLITVYGLNVVAWGGMLFLLLCNASPAMCHPTCNDINSPRRIWIEIDSQILNALFCVTGFGLVPWRFRDWWWWGVWRLGFGKQAWGASRAERKSYGLRKLAGINRGWFRLPGSEALPPTFPDHQDPQNPAKPQKPGKGGDVVVEVPEGVDEKVLPTPLYKTPDPPPTGVRAPPTKQWKIDFVVWCNVWNTFFQACLAGFMWGMNRYDRPSWSTGLFVALACIVAAAGGICMFMEGKAVKKVEGVPMETWRKDQKEALDEEKAAERDDR